MDFVRDWWGVVMAAVAGLVWLSRLEWRGLQNEAEIRRLWAQRKEDLDAAKAAREETNDMLKEIRGDIKKLLTREAN